LQVLTDTAQHAFSSSLTLHYNREIIRVTGELVTAFFKFFIQRIEHDIRQ
jgi:hypothetical protein